MPTFRICQYEIATQEYLVKADTPADAIVALLAGKGECTEGGSEFVEVCEDYGIMIEGNEALASELSAKGVRLGDDFIPSIAEVGELTFTTA